MSWSFSDQQKSTSSSIISVPFIWTGQCASHTAPSCRLPSSESERRAGGSQTQGANQQGNKERKHTFTRFAQTNRCLFFPTFSGFLFLPPSTNNGLVKASTPAVANLGFQTRGFPSSHSYSSFLIFFFLLFTHG